MYLMSNIKKISLLVILIFFSGCGGGGGNSGGQPIISEPIPEPPEVIIPEPESFIPLDVAMKGAGQGMTNDGVNIIYGTNDGKIHSINPVTGKITYLYNTGEKINGLAYRNNGEYFYSSLSSKTINALNIDNNTSEVISNTAWPDGLDLYRDKIYVVTANRNGNLTILNTNGEEYGSIDTGIDDIVGITHTDRFLYILAESGDIYQTDSETGVSNLIFINENLAEHSDGVLGLEAITILNNYIYISNVSTEDDSSIYKIDINLSDYE